MIRANKLVVIMIVSFSLVGGCGKNRQHGGETNKKPPLIYSPISQSLSYVPQENHGYYSPGRGTVNISYTKFTVPILSGEKLPSSLLVLIQFSKTLAHIGRDGEVKWTYPTFGRYVSSSPSQIFVGSLDDNKKVDVLGHDGKLLTTLTFTSPINYVRAEKDRLIVVYNERQAPVDIFEWKGDQIGNLLFRSIPVSHSRAARLTGKFLTIADTFGHKVIIQNVDTGEIELSYPAWFPNDIAWSGGFLYVVEEHADRIIAINVVTNETHIVMAPPRTWRWGTDIPVGTDPPEFCRNESPYPRSLSSDICSGMFTLYAPNGMLLEDNGIIVADTDNSRVIFVKDGKVVSALVGLNNPVKLDFAPDI